MSDEILIGGADAVATVTLNPPDKPNAMTAALLRALPGSAPGEKLIEIIGPAHTRHLLLTGRPIEARRAREIGMVHEVVPAADLDTATAKLARTIADNAPLSLAGIKALIQRALAARETVSHDDIDALIQASRRSQDASEGRRAMLEKRKPVFRGE